jgi:dTDP-L-rhamnose 4-epimerase
VLITGGAGFIGRATTKVLLERGHSVTVVDVLQQRVHPNGWPPDMDSRVQRFRQDVRDLTMWNNHLPEHDAVLHLAAYQDYQTDYGKFFETNVVSTAYLYEIANTHNWRGQVVVASSSSTLGEGTYECTNCSTMFLGVPRTPHDLAAGAWEMHHLCDDGVVAPGFPTWTREEDWSPITPYGVSKQAEEQTALVLGNMLEIPSVALRYSIVQGAGQSPWNAYSGVMRASCLQILAGRDVVLFEDGQQQRDFISIHDVVDANVRALEGEVPPGGYNVGGGSRWSIKDMVEKMIEISGRDISTVIPGWYRVGDVRHTLSEISKIEDVCVWRPRSSLRIDRETWPEYWDWLSSLDLPAEQIVQDAFDNMKKSGVLLEAK